ncbi:MAG TPA: M23 family metallopeptidase [Sphingopyxis sp.]|uniref:M23 family metallopeptidase n=1 Tax=Sphingopyxis sp. TaxID=1908224 RepID=UPI002E121F7A|nr:M23 family metallopeptidase [Sphingopyxis sp.]
MTLARYLPRLAAALPLLLVAAGCVAPDPARDVAAPPPAAKPSPGLASLTVPPPAAILEPFVFRGSRRSAEQGGVLLGVAPSHTRALTLDGQPVPVDTDGGFLVAFDRDAGPRARLVATVRDGRQVAEEIIVTPGTWRIEQVNAPYRGSAASDADFARRRPAELAQIAAARTMQVQSDGWKQRFRWPVTGRLSGHFGSQRVYQGRPGAYHSGTDIAVPAGTPFVAPADGVVVLAATTPFTLEGHLLIVDHGMGLSSAFLHCQRLDVKVGDIVVQGQALGTVGRTGRATGPHLHWGLKWRDARLDPSKIAGPIGG